MTHQHQSMIDKTARIVFASNVPTDVTEDKIRDVFSRIGPISSFRVICDKDPATGKSKCYTVCEYKDQETALMAVKGLNNFEMAGRLMKVDHAFNEKTRLEMISVMQNAQNNDKTPETISKAVASLPPEQMFELLKQMKQCIQNNPEEAKRMLLQNPQLAYALLQALVVMRVVDPEIAFRELSNTNAPATTASAMPTASSIFDSSMSASSMINRLSSSVVAATVEVKPVPKPVPPVVPNMTTTASTTRSTVSIQPVPPPAPSIPLAAVPPPAPVVHDIDLRTKPGSIVDRLDQDKMKAPVAVTDSFKRDPRLQNQGLKSVSGPPRTTAPLGVPTPVPPVPPVAAPAAPRVVTTTGATTVSSSASTGANKPAAATSTPDKEKAALIMQVLRLTDEQIATLPPEQRQSILLLKEQIAKSAKR